MGKHYFKDKKLTWILMILSIFFFCFLGEWGYMEMRDTSSYILPNLTEGIMPVYPFILNVLHVLFGNSYLTVAAYFQGLLASICVTVFSCYLVRKFSLKDWEGVLIWTATLLPFAVELPEYVVTHMIYTEGISYSLYYVFVICILNLIWEKTWKRYSIALGMTLLLGLVRSQLALLLIIWGVMCFPFIISKAKKRTAGAVLACANMALAVVFGVLLIYGIRGLYIQTIGKGFENHALTVQSREDVDKQTKKDEAVNVEDDQPVQASENVASQFGSAIISRGFYEADAEDVKYYKTEEMKEIFRRVFAKCDEKQYRYVYAKKGLWMWEDLTQPYIYHEADAGIVEYYQSKGIKMPQEELNAKLAEIKLTLGITEIAAHPLRFGYHCARLMVPGFISCIFFNIEKIYLLCHLITLFLYLSAICMMTANFRSGSAVKDAGWFMFFVIVGCVIFVGVTNLVFFGMQRYFLYQMGVFYCAYYLLFRSYAISLWEKRKRK